MLDKQTDRYTHTEEQSNHWANQKNSIFQRAVCDIEDYVGWTKPIINSHEGVILMVQGGHWCHGNWNVRENEMGSWKAWNVREN